MRIHSKTASLVFKSIIVVVGCIALVSQLGLFAGAFRPRFFYFFTNLSNVVAIAYLIGAMAHLVRSKSNQSDTWAPPFKYAAMMSVTVTCLVAYFLLGGGLIGPEGGFSPALLVLHFIVPIGSVLDWLLFDEKGHMSLAGPFTWIAFPLIYFVYVLFMVNVLGISMNGFGDGRYPYPFIDIDILGAGTVALTSVALAVAFVALGYIYVGIDRLLAQLKKRHPRHT